MEGNRGVEGGIPVLMEQYHEKFKKGIFSLRKHVFIQLLKIWKIINTSFYRLILKNGYSMALCPIERNAINNLKSNLHLSELEKNQKGTLIALESMFSYHSLLKRVEKKRKTYLADHSTFRGEGLA